MPRLNRRTLFQFLGAAGAAAALPLPAAPRSAVAGSTATSQALWASLYAKSGSATGFAKVAKGMGLSRQAALGVGSRVAGVQIVAGTAHSAVPQPGKHSLWQRFNRAIDRLEGDVNESQDASGAVDDAEQQAEKKGPNPAPLSSSS